MAGVSAAQGYEQITSLSSAKSLTPPANAKFAVITVEGGTARRELRAVIAARAPEPTTT